MVLKREINNVIDETVRGFLKFIFVALFVQLVNFL